MSDLQQITNEIADLKREIVEARNMNIKTDNSMRALFAEIKKVTTNQKSAERRARFASLGAYILFALIIGFAAFWVSGVKASQLSLIIDDQKTALAGLQREVETLKADIETRHAAEKRAVFLLNLIREEKKDEAVREYRKTEMASFSRVESDLLQERIDAFAKELAKRHFERGVSQWKIGGYASAVQEFERALDYQPDLEDYASLQYFMGLSLFQTRKYEAAIAALRTAISSEVKLDWSSNARVKIAEALIADKKLEEALLYMEAIPNEQLRPPARQEITQKIAQAKRQLARQREEAKEKPETDE